MTEKERQEEENRARLRVGAKAEIAALVAALAKILDDGAREAEEDGHHYDLATFNAAQRLVERLEIAAQRIN
jgi:hypothetical protein